MALPLIFYLWSCVWFFDPRKPDQRHPRNAVGARNVPDQHTNKE